MEKINIAELLKDCPSGMELNCTMYENVYFDKTYNEEDCLYPIGCYIIGDNNRNSVNFTKYGEFNYHSNAKCIIFPKGKTTWEGFHRPFRDGDIVVGKNCACSYITIFREFINNTSFSHYVCLTSFGKINVDDISDNANLRLATEEEKQKLFDAIKSNGYHWNDETKTLEKLIEPKFKVGNKIRLKSKRNHVYTIHSLTWDNNKLAYRLLPDNDKHLRVVSLITQDDYELVPNKFDINTLVPFESKVLVRDKNNDKWIGQFFSHYDNGSDRPYVCIGIEGLCEYKKCIPFKNNEYLLGKTDDCDEYYKTW